MLTTIFCISVAIVLFSLNQGLCQFFLLRNCFIILCQSAIVWSIITYWTDILQMCIPVLLGKQSSSNYHFYEGNILLCVLRMPAFFLELMDSLNILHSICNNILHSICNNIGSNDQRFSNNS